MAIIDCLKCGIDKIGETKDPSGNLPVGLVGFAILEILDKHIEESGTPHFAKDFKITTIKGSVTLSDKALPQTETNTEEKKVIEVEMNW